MNPKRHKMSPDEISRRVSTAVAEYFDGYILIAYTADEQQPVVIHQASNPKTALALNAMMMNVVSRGGVSSQCPETQ